MNIGNLLAFILFAERDLIVFAYCSDLFCPTLLLQGKKVAVCSAATKSSVILCLENLIGMVSSFMPLHAFRNTFLLNNLFIY